MILFLYGKDTYRSRRQLKEMVEKFKKDRDPQGLNVSRLDALKRTPGEILGEVLASPFLAERRMVVVENLLVSKHTDLMEEVLERAENKAFPESNIVLFWEETDTFKTKAAKALYERLAKEQFAQRYDTLDSSSVQKWIVAEVTKRGGAIELPAVAYLALHTKADTWQLSTLIDQLIAYRAGEKITMADGKLFLDEKADDNIFNLVDAIVGKEPKRAYAMIAEQYRIGEDAQFIFAMLIRQFRILLELRDLFERDKMSQSDEVAKKLGLHPFVVKKSHPLVKRYSMEELTHTYNDLLVIDKKTKTGQGDQSMLLDIFVGTR